jgi:diaminohydroxyphosphoribosylaminopyrimidine deaminase/5-amino-6-(5-phosphoribosylamino)uracil reductase
MSEYLEAMDRALELAAEVRQITPPNPWVGAVVISADGLRAYEGATEAPGGRHAEIVALDSAGHDAQGGTIVVTLEPCSHFGRTPPCTDAIVAAGIARVVLATRDPDANVNGGGVTRLVEAGIEVVEGVRAPEAVEMLAAYLHHRRTGRPLVVLKLASTLDGRTAAPDATSKWITGEEARRDVARLRAECDAIVVGAGTVRADDPELTARTDPPPHRQPLRVVLGSIPEGARVNPAISLSGDLGEILDDLGGRGILQVLIEGGATVAHAFVAARLVDRFVIYLAPAIMGGDDGAPVLSGPGAPTLGDLWRGRFISVVRLGADLRLEVAA